MDYQRRVIDEVLDRVFPDLAAIAIEGAKGVGKTATASRRAATTFSLALPRTRSIVSDNVDVVAEADPPVFIDEWQLEPAIWDRVRMAVDEAPTSGGRFLLAGSAGASPRARIHSGAGRIVRLMMRPMALSERGISETTVSLRALHNAETTVTGSTPVTLRHYVDEILRTGFPGIRNLPDEARELQLDSYLDRIVDKDLPENGVTIRRPAAMRQWLRAYGAATASTTDYTKILNAATAGDADKPSRATVDSYREHLNRLFILDPVEAWTPAVTPLKQLALAPKHHLVDPGLAARMVGIGARGLLLGEGEVPSPGASSWLGALFESLAVQSVRIYAAAMNARVAHLRTSRGEHEIDIIVETNDQRVTALEVKLSDTVGDDDVKHLRWLGKELGQRLVDSVVLYTGPVAYRRKDGIAVVPLALLGP